MSANSQSTSTKRTRTPETELVDSEKKQRLSAAGNEIETSARTLHHRRRSQHLDPRTTISVGAAAPPIIARDPVHGSVLPQPPTGLPSPLPNQWPANPLNPSSPNTTRIPSTCTSKVAIDASHPNVASGASSTQVSMMAPQQQSAVSLTSLTDPPSAVNFQSIVENFDSRRLVLRAGPLTVIRPGNAVWQVMQPTGSSTHMNAAHRTVTPPVSQLTLSVMPTSASDTFTFNPPAPELNRPQAENTNSNFLQPDNSNLENMQMALWLNGMAPMPQMDQPQDPFGAASELTILNPTVSNIDNTEIRRVVNLSPSLDPVNPVCRCDICQRGHQHYDPLTQLVNHAQNKWVRNETLTEQEFICLLLGM